MADAKLTALSAITALTADDLLYVVDDPGGTPASKKITVANALLSIRDGLTLTATKTAAYTAVVGDHVLCDSNGASGNFAVTLPASPSNGDRVRVTLITDHASRTVTIGRNGSNINGGTSTGKFRLVLEGDTVDLNYVGGDTGWTTTRQFTLHTAKFARSAAQSISASTETKIAVDTETWDVGGIADIATNDRIDIRRDGKYKVLAEGAVVSPNTIQYSEIWVNGSRVAFSGARLSGGTTVLSTIQSQTLATLDLVAGDYVELYLFHNNTVASNTTTDADRRPTLTIDELQ